MRLMRASRRGSNRRVIVVDSRVSALSREPFMSRTSSRASAQNTASSSSLSKCGTSRQLVMTFIGDVRRSVGALGVLAVVEGKLLRRHVPREQGAVAFSIGPENGEDPAIAHGFAKIEIARL